MTVESALRAAYLWTSGHGLELLLYLGLLFPAASTVIARIGKGGKTDADGKFMASIFVGLAVLQLIAALLVVLVARSFFNASILEADLALVLTPPITLLLTLGGIRWVFPLNQLASWRTIGDLTLFVMGCGAAFWFLSKFRGWGIIFFGSMLQLAVFVALGFFLLRRLFRRAFRGES